MTQLTKEDVKELIKEYLKENLEITINSHSQRLDVDYGTYRQVERYTIEISLDNETLAEESFSVMTS